MYRSTCLDDEQSPRNDYGIPLDPLRGGQYNRLLELAAIGCGTGYALIDFFEGNWEVYSHEFLNATRSYYPGNLYSRIAIGSEIVVIGDMNTKSTLESDRPLLNKQPMRFCAVKPLRSPNGSLVGALCVFDHKRRAAGLGVSGRKTLDIVAEQIEILMGLKYAILERDQNISRQHATVDRLDRAATHDLLTSLPNRMAFQSRISSFLADRDLDSPMGALLLVDIDHFKQANDLLGHVGGDHVLQCYAERLKSLTGPSDMVARIGGDEFAILCPDLRTKDDAKQLAESIMQGMRLPMVYAGRTVDGRSSIGIALCPNHGLDIEALTKAADLALQAAKCAGRDRYILFDVSLAHRAAEHESVLSAARAAICDGRLRVHYQPIMALDSGGIQGLEALLRWVLPSGELILPGAWAAAFDDPQLAPAISRCVLDLVLHDVAEWLATGVQFGHVAINAGALDFSCGTFTEELLSAMAARQLPPDVFQIEVTEMVLLGRSNGQVARALTALNKCGISIALDDFGTGYASLLHLKRYPIHTVKIDQSFVAGLTGNAEDRAIVKSIITLAKDLGIKSIAEGIETAPQAAFLREEGCDYGQGFLFSKALPFDQVNDLFARASPFTSPPGQSPSI